MSGVAAAGVGLLRPSKLTRKNITFSLLKPNPITSISYDLSNTTTEKTLGLGTHLHNHQILSSATTLSTTQHSPPHLMVMDRLQVFLMDLDPATAKLAIGLLGPFLSAFGFLFVARIVMSWYPKLPVGKFPYVIAYVPTEPILFLTRKVIPPLGGVDVTPVVWFALISFLNEILVGPQGLLVLLSQQKV